MLIPAFGLYPCGADLRSVCAAVRRSHPTGISQAACGGLAEGVGLVAFGDLSPARTAFSSHRNISSRLRRIGGRGGIRTHGWFNPTLDFESSALNRTQPPFQMTWNYSSSAVA